MKCRFDYRPMSRSRSKFPSSLKPNRRSFEFGAISRRGMRRPALHPTFVSGGCIDLAESQSSRVVLHNSVPAPFMPESAYTVLSPRDVERGRLLIFAAAVLWSLAGVFIKFLDLHPLSIVFYRSLFASLIFVPFLRR